MITTIIIALGLSVAYWDYKHPKEYEIDQALNQCIKEYQEPELIKAGGSLEGLEAQETCIDDLEELEDEA